MGRLCAIAAGAIFPPEIPRAAQRNSQGGWASSPNLPMSFQPCSSLNLETERSVNTQGKGNPEGEFKGEGQKQDKSRASQVTPGRSQRPAVRAAFRAFSGRGKSFQNSSEILSGYHIRRHFGTEKTLLASGLPENQPFQGVGTMSVLLSKAFGQDRASDP